MVSVFKIYSSSAGSGKTYTLAKEYIKLALHSPSPDYYRSILAITFTNDAAAEMKERIIGNLRKFNSPDLAQRATVEALLQQITQELNEEYTDENLKVEEVRKRAAQVFRQILYNYADFSVSTIDSFVNKIVQAFARDLNIPHNFEVDLDSDTLLSTAVALLLDKVKNEKGDLLTETLEHFILEKAGEGKSWSMFSEELAQFARNLLNEQVYEAITDLKKLTLEDFRRVQQELRAFKLQIEQELQAPAQEALQLIDTNGLTPADFYQSTRGIWSFFNKWTQKYLDLTYTNSNAYKTINEDKWYGGKADALTKSQIDSIKPHLTDLYNQITDLQEKYAGTYTLLNAVMPHLYKLSVLNELEKCLQEIKQDKNTVHISEFNKRIIDIVLKEPVPFIYERLGEKYNHILIDEFQDTSVLQWNNLLPLVENAVASGHFSMVVGDAKQAIYRWRGGEMEQILHLYKGTPEKLYEHRRESTRLQERYQTFGEEVLQPENLDSNYRSRNEIIEFNNDLFTFASQNHKAYETFTSIYDEGFVQKSPKPNNTGGHIQIMFTYEGDANTTYNLNTCERTTEIYPGTTHKPELSYEESMLSMVLQLVEQNLADGYTLKDMAVLCRTNHNSRLIANYLKEHQYDIISQDSLSLQFAEVVNLIIALFRVLNRPADALAKSEALYLVHKVTLKHIPDVTITQRIAQVANQPEAAVFYDYIRELGFNVDEKNTGNLSIYELTERLIRIFDLLGHNNECDYVFRFLDLVLEYSLKHSNNLNNFLAYWDVQKEKLSINTPKNRNAITITSIHKSKGLAYPVVIVPFADWSTKPKPGSLMWSQLPDEVAQTLNLPSVAVTTNKKLEHTILAGQYNTEIEKTFIENMNMLYVALTRPEDRLYLIGNGRDLLQENKMPKTDTPADNVSHLLYLYLQSIEQWQPGKLCYQLHKGNAPQLRDTTLEEATFYLNYLQTNEWEQRLKIKQHANNVFDFETQQRQRQVNRKLHYALSRITFAPEVNQVLRQMVYEGIISERDKPELLKQLTEVVQHPKMAYYFSNKVAIEQEKEVLDARAYLYKPDRIVFDAETVTLIEFKSPPPEPEHLNRLDHYAVRFRQLGYKKVRCVLYYFDTQEVKEWQYGDKPAEQLGLAF